MHPIRSHDALFRFVFGDAETLAELLRAQLPGEVAAAIDWASLRPADRDFVDEVLQERRSDLLFEVDLHGRPALLHVLCDHKSDDERFTALQLVRYTVRILDRWLLDHEGAKWLPPVLAIVVHHGDRPWASPRNLADLHELQEHRGLHGQHGPARSARLALRTFLQPYLLRSGFLLVDLAAMDESAIDAMRLSAVGALTLRFLQFLRRSDPAESATLIAGWTHLVAELLDHPRGRNVITALFSWYLAGVPDRRETLRTVMNKIEEENPPMRSALDLLLDMGHERGLKEGLERGVAQGVQQGLAVLRTVLQNLLQARFGPLDAHHAAQLSAADTEELRAIGERLATATSLHDVFA